MVINETSAHQGLIKNDRNTCMLQVILCDDDRTFLDYLYNIVDRSEDYSGHKIHIQQFSGMEEISDYIISICDIAILDIDFAGKHYNGIDIARKIKKERPGAVIIFLTNYIEYAPEGYEVQAFRYLLKSDVKVKLKNYLKAAVRYYDDSRRTIKIKSDGEIIDLLVEDITYLESQQHHVQIWVHPLKASKARSHVCYTTLRKMEEDLEPLGFLRTHKSYLVNMHRIQKYQCQELILDDGTTLRVSERSYAEQKKKYLLWKGIKSWN